MGLTGDITINENGDREADYTLNDMDPETGIMVPIATFFGSRRIYDKRADIEINWPGKNGPPPDIPPCGFTGDAPECISIGGKFVFSEESWFSLDSASKRAFIWREPGSRYRPPNVIEKDHYGRSGLMVWVGIRADGYVGFHVFNRVTLNGQWYRDEILAYNVIYFRAAYELNFIFMDDTAHPHT
ncbi:atrial natriuretic peptide receptor 1 [Trichonephila clavipes]|nr:atrial natriuretic peptide receptor 1 [Trichonephila clavipes]